MYYSESVSEVGIIPILQMKLRLEQVYLPKEHI